MLSPAHSTKFSFIRISGSKRLNTRIWRLTQIVILHLKINKFHCRCELQTLGPHVRIICILGALGIRFQETKP